MKQPPMTTTTQQNEQNVGVQKESGGKSFGGRGREMRLALKTLT
jgi:hypothetical protein